MRHLVAAMLVTLAAAPISGVAPLAAQQQHPHPQTRVLSRVDSNTRTLLANTHPAFIAHAAIGRRVQPSTQLTSMVLVLQPSPEQESALRTHIDLQQDRASPLFHQWLTPETFAQIYGVSAHDIAAVIAWLEDNGLAVNQVSHGARFVTFSGPAAAVEAAFHTELHHLVRNGESHVGNTTDLSVPAALAPVVRGVARLDDFYRRQAVPRGNPLHLQKPSPGGPLHAVPAAGTQPTPLFDSSPGRTHFVAPGDAAIIYNALPLTSAGIDGHGTTIAVLGRSNITQTAVAAFRSLFGLPANPPTVTVLGSDPGLGDDATEAFLDTEWAGAIAPAASVRLIVGAPSLVGAGIDTASLYAVDNNIGDILTLSYGECETDATAAGTAFWNSLWQQAAAQGQTVFVSAGDSGAAGCDSSSSPATNSGYAVNALGSSAYNVSVGGTMFVDYGPAQFWGTASASFSTALGYIPEAAWNQGQLGTTHLNDDSTATVSDSGIIATGGGVSIDTARPPWQTGSHISSLGDPSGTAPGSTIAGLHRLVPDLALLGSFGHDGTVYCGDGMCQDTTATDIYDVGVVGGTSISAPTMAGIQALINARNGGRQGSANYVYYALAARQSAAGLNCQSINGTPGNPAVTLPASTCDFHDIVSGSNLVPVSTTSNTLGVGFQASVGFDEATGLGSVDIANLANDWSTVGFHGSVSSLTLTPATGIAHGTRQAFTITVAPGAGSGTPTGEVTLLASSTGATGSPQRFTLTGGTASGTVQNLPGGTYAVHAHYAGDGAFAPSDSAPIDVNIAREASILTLTPKRVDTLGNASATHSFTYGDSLLDLAADIAAHSGNGTPGGTVTYTVEGATGQSNAGSLPALTVPLDSLASTALLSGPTYPSPGLPANYPTLPAGTYTATASYTGDSSFLASTASSSFTIGKATPAIAFTTPSATVDPGTPVTFRFSIATPLAAAPATGTVQILDSTANTNLCAVTLVSGSATSIGSATCTTSALTSPGMHILTATYPGDGNYLASTAPPIQLNVQASALALTVAPLSIPFGTPTATVTANVNAAISGSLTLSVDGATPIPALCAEAAALTSCTAQISGLGLPSGTHALLATFTSGTLQLTRAANLTVTPATALLTLSALNAVGNGQPHAVLAATVPAGLPVTITYNGVQTAPSATGIYAVLATIHSPNYTGSAAASLRIDPPAAAIAFAVPAHHFGDAPFPIAATSASAGAFTYTVLSGPANLSGSTITLTGAGTVVLQAEQAASGSFNAASAQATFTVSRAVPVITWPSPLPIAFGTPLTVRQLNAAATLNGQAIAGNFTYTPALGTIPAAGNQSLQATFTPADPINFSPATASVTILVQPSPTALTLTASANPALAGAPLTLTATVTAGTAPTPSGTVAGTVVFTANGSPLGTLALINGTASLTVTLPAGSYAIVASFGGSQSANPTSATLSETIATAVPFTLGTPATPALNLALGQPANLPLTITPAPTFAGTVTLSCANLPATATCTFSTPSINFDKGSAPQILNLRIDATPQHGSIAATPSTRPASPSPVQQATSTTFAQLPTRGSARPATRFAARLAAILGLSGLLLVGISGRRLPRCLALLLLLTTSSVCCGALTGCGRALDLTPATTPSAPAPSTVSIQVVARSGNTLQTLPVTLTLP